MEKEFVPYELALRMKQLGFDEPCWGYYHVNEGYSIGYAFCYSDRESQPEIGCSTPTYSQAFRWFREKYDLYSWIQLHNGYINDSFYSELPITFSIMDRKTGNKYYERDIPHNYLYKTNEEVELACLKELIEIVEQKEK
jgi:hypothetical protein